MGSTIVFLAAIQLALLIHCINVGFSSSTRLELVHRSSPNSPVYKPHYSDRVRLLKDLIRIDKQRLDGFRHQQRSLLQRSAAILGDEEVISSALTSGSSIGSGQYFAEFAIGTPPRSFPLIVDTGSDLTWVRCNPSDPDQQAPIYNRNSSSSFKEMLCSADECMLVPAPNASAAICPLKNPTACEYAYRYGDQSQTTGIMGTETFQMRVRSFRSKNNNKIMKIENVAFGCGLVNSGTSFKGASGVLGLGQGQVSFNSQIGQTFSYCLVNYLAASATNTSSELVFGPSPTWRNASKLQYTPLVRNPAGGSSFYYVNVSHVAVNEKVVEGSEIRANWEIDKDGNRGTVFDSGTTLSYFRQPAYSAIIRALNETIGLPKVAKNPSDFELCYNVSSYNSDACLSKKVPRVEVVFEGGAVMRLPPDNFMVLAAKDVKCVSMMPVTTEWGFNVIGNLLQQDFWVQYDQVKGRVGFQSSLCSAAKR